jgi:hypothetical protein
MMGTSYSVYWDDWFSLKLESLEPRFSIVLVVALKVIPSFLFSCFSVPFLCCCSQFGLPTALQVCDRNQVLSIFTFPNTPLYPFYVSSMPVVFLLFSGLILSVFLLAILLRHTSTLLYYSRNICKMILLGIHQLSLKVFKTTIASPVNIDVNFVVRYWCLISPGAVTHQKPTNSWFHICEPSVK